MFFLGISDQHEADRRESFGIQFFFRILGCQKCCFHEIRRSNITAFRRSLHRQDFVRCLFGAALPPPPQPGRSVRSNHEVIIRADFNIFNFRKLAIPFPSLQGTFQKHFQLPNLPPLFQPFRHQGHQGPQGPRLRQIFGLQIAPQWSHRHRDQGPNVLNSYGWWMKKLGIFGGN